MRRIAPNRTVRLPDRIGRITALLGLFGTAALGVLACWSPDRAGAEPVSPLVIDRAFGLSGAMPWVSPTGEQLVTYLSERQGALSVPGLKARTDGEPFSPFEALTPSAGLSPPSAAIGPDGDTHLVWEAAGAEVLTEQAIRPAGGPPGVTAPAGACNGPAAVAASSTGRTLLACLGDSGSTPRRIGLVGIGQVPSPITPGVEVTPAINGLTGKPLVAWGSNGTGIVVFGYTEDGSPGQRKVAARIVSPGGSLGATEIVDSVAAPATLVPTGAAVLPNGTATITANSGDGGILFVRPPGAGQSFERIDDLEQTTASMPSADRWGRLHFLTSSRATTGETTWWVRVLELDGTVGRPIRVPTEGLGAEPVVNGLQVSPKGAEAIVTRSDSGFYRSQRKPGAGAFSVPKKLADSTEASLGAVTRTPKDDLLLVWKKTVSTTRKQLVVGGWDGNGRPVIERLSIPKRVRRGALTRLSVVAKDPMGISRIVWALPGNRKLRGASVRTRFRKPGPNQVRVTAFDRAGNRSLRIKEVKVSGARKPGVQGRAGTSGSPRP